MAKKKSYRTSGIVKGKTKEQRLEKAYQEWKTGKQNSLKTLSDKYHIHIPIISKYITEKMNISKNKNL